jgi:hypothetical protein
MDVLLRMQMLNIAFVMMVMHDDDNRNPCIVEQRLLWDTFTGRFGARREFTRSIRMKLESFNLLLSYIRNDLTVDEIQASRKGTPIIPELCLFCTIRYLAGASYLDIRFLTGISVSSIYRIISKTMWAIMICKEIKIKFPLTADECKEAALGFESVSTGGCISNCVSVIDGYLLAFGYTDTSKVGCTQCAILFLWTLSVPWCECTSCL